MLFLAPRLSFDSGRNRYAEKCNRQPKDAMLTLPMCDNERGVFVASCVDVVNILETRLKRNMALQQGKPDVGGRALIMNEL